MVGKRESQRESDLSSSEDSDEGGEAASRLTFLHASDDPRTLSQMKRSRIDLARRYVFLCPTSLSKHFDSLPHQAKDGALLVFRCSRSWLFADPPSERISRLHARVDTGLRSGARPNTASTFTTVGAGQSKLPLSQVLYRSEYSREFLQWVLTKEKEGCVFWFKPERSLVKMSSFFEEKIDPVSEMPYRPLLLDPAWWRVRFQRTTARYIGTPSPVVAAIADAALASASGSFRGELPTPRSPSRGEGHMQDIAIPTLQELIYQSNPSLEPLAKWPHAPSMRFVPREPPSRKGFAEEAKPKRFIEMDTSRVVHLSGF